MPQGRGVAQKPTGPVEQATGLFSMVLVSVFLLAAFCAHALFYLPVPSILIFVIVNMGISEVVANAPRGFSI